MGLILLIVLLVVFLGSAPAFPYARGWGYQPMGIVGLLLVLLLVALAFDLLPFGFTTWHTTTVVR